MHAVQDEQAMCVYCCTEAVPSHWLLPLTPSFQPITAYSLSLKDKVGWERASHTLSSRLAVGRRISSGRGAFSIYRVEPVIPFLILIKQVSISGAVLLEGNTLIYVIIGFKMRLLCLSGH